MKRATLRFAPAAVTVVLLFLLWRQLRPGTLLTSLTGASLAWVGLGIVLFVGVMLVRAIRFGVLLSKRVRPDGVDEVASVATRVPLRALVPLSFVVSLLGNTLPLRGSDVSFLVLSRTHVNVPMADATAALAVVRLLDLVAVVAWFVPLAYLALPALPAAVDVPVAGTPTWLWLLLATVMLVAAAAAILLAAAFGRRAAVVLDAGVRRLGFGDWPHAQRFVAFAYRTAEALVHQRRTRRLLGALALSLVAWLFTFGWLYAFAVALGGVAGFGTFIVGATFSVLSKALPAPTLGGHGVSETGWALGMTLVGWPKDVAIATGLGVSVLNLGVVALFGVPCLILLERSRRDVVAGRNAGALS